MPKTERIGPCFYSEPAEIGETAKRVSLPCYSYCTGHSCIYDFQQDGAFTHWSVDVGRSLDTKVFQCCICREDATARASREPGLTPLEFFLWNYMYNVVHSVDIASLSHMEQSTNQAIEGISTRVLKMAWENINFRFDHVVSEKGVRVEHNNV